MPQTILVVEDDELIADSVRYGLEHEGYRVVTARDGAAGLVAARGEAPDLVLMDIMMPVLDGLQATRTLRSESSVPIILLTARGEEVDKVVGLELGADDYVVKPFGMRELVARIRAVLRRRDMTGHTAGTPTAAMSVGEILLDRESHVVTKRGDPVALRPKEFDLLSVLMTQPGRAFERGELLDVVWGDDWIGDPRTLDVHVRWLRQKLEDDPATPRYIQTVRGLGYRFTTKEDLELT